MSPNVNLASRLEAATKKYKVSLLISGNLHETLNPRIQNYCREIDIVTLKGSIKPIKLFTVDLCLKLAPVEEKDYSIVEKKRHRHVQKVDLWLNKLKRQ